MGRTARKRSRTGIYHIMLRGNNKQEIFERDSDSRVFLKILARAKQEMPFQLHACCFMGNHIHLLLMEEPAGFSVSAIMRTVVSQYVMWYNHEYERVGNLFQDRFKSETVEDIDYYKTVFRYIHQNPLKGNLEKKLGEYRWSSYGVYRSRLAEETANDLHRTFQYLNDWSAEGEMIIDPEFPIMAFGSLQFLLDFCGQKSEENCMDIDRIGGIEKNDDRARRIIAEISGCKTPTDFQKLPKSEKKDYVRQFLVRGLKKAQIRRLCGVSAYMIDSVCGNMNKL